jgi:hypothetical protein
MKPALRRSRRLRFKVCATAVAVLSWLVMVPLARAALGDDAAAIDADQARLGARVKVMRRTGYSVHELAAPTGGTVREFAADAGKVFAVAWSGGFRPNLRDVMGSHYDRFIAATRGRRVARGVSRIELPGMVVVMGSYLRTSWGHVVLTDLLPAGVSADDVQ